LNTVISVMGSLPNVLNGAAFSAADAARVKTSATAIAEAHHLLNSPIVMRPG
jgi:hypothetical protein